MHGIDQHIVSIDETLSFQHVLLGTVLIFLSTVCWTPIAVKHAMDIPVLGYSTVYCQVHTMSRQPKKHHRFSNHPLLSNLQYGHRVRSQMHVP